MSKKILLILLGLVTIYLTYIFLHKSNEFPPSELADDYLNVHFIDVGQGNATLLKGPDFTVLIDAGRHDRNDVVPYLHEQNVKKIDLLVGTHPHADHIGQFPQVLENFTVNEVWLSGDTHTSKTFERALDAIIETNAKYHEPRANEMYSYGPLDLEIVHPKEITGDLNNGSIVLRMIYHNITFMFTGDAELEAELEIVERGHELKSDILQIGHHGSKTSTSDQFLEKVSPKITVYSAAKNNIYGHPHTETIKKLNDLGIVVYGTDRTGTIVLTTDGETYMIEANENDSIEILNTTNINSASENELTEIFSTGVHRVEH